MQVCRVWHPGPEVVVDAAALAESVEMGFSGRQNWESGNVFVMFHRL
jgi:hypothetical protein